MFSEFDEKLFWRKRITIVVPDRTRALDYQTTLVPIVAYLKMLQAEINFYVALGLHRQMDEDELTELQAIADSVDAKVKQHRSQSGALQKTNSGVAFHRRYILGVDLIINVGVVEPHQYAGFSGGVKGLAIGCADAPSISRMHHISYLKNPNVGVAKLTDNIFQKNLCSAVSDLPEIYGLFMVPKTKRVFFGEVEGAFIEATELSRKVHFKVLPSPVEWMEVSVPESKSQNFYQASRAATYLALVENSALVDGGHILLRASCPEKIGIGEGEKACANIMKKGRDFLLEKLEKSHLNDISLGGEQRAYVIAQAMQRCSISLIGAPSIPELEALGVHQFRDMIEAKKHFRLQDSTGLFVGSPFHEIPVLDIPGVPSIPGIPGIPSIPRH